MTALAGFIIVPTEVGPIVIGVAQIASIQPGGRRSQHANVRMGNGEIFAVTTNVDAVLDLIDGALDEELPAPVPKQMALPSSPSAPNSALAQTAATSTEPEIGLAALASALGVSPVPHVEIKVETKRRGRPPKNKSA